MRLARSRTARQVIESGDTERRTENCLVERLLHTEIDRFGDIAHVLCTYEVLDSADRTEPAARGVGSLQLWCDGDRWWGMLSRRKVSEQALRSRSGTEAHGTRD